VIARGNDPAMGEQSGDAHDSELAPADRLASARRLRVAPASRGGRSGHAVRDPDAEVDADVAWVSAPDARSWRAVAVTRDLEFVLHAGTGRPPELLVTPRGGATAARYVTNRVRGGGRIVAPGTSDLRLRPPLFAAGWRLTGETGRVGRISAAKRPGPAYVLAFDEPAVPSAAGRLLLIYRFLVFDPVDAAAGRLPDGMSGLNF
jgi:hypothetical protein